MTSSNNILFLSSYSPIAQKAFENISTKYNKLNWKHFDMNQPSNIKEFKELDIQGSIIISFLNPYILEKSELLNAQNSYNFHPASPKYPGRDPQHFAIYNQENKIGATLHSMNESVDSGIIFDVIEKSINQNQSITEIDGLSSKLCYKLLLKNIHKIINGTIEPSKKWSWDHANKKTRKDFISYSKITPEMTKQEIERRIKAFHVQSYVNKVHVKIKGKYFIFDEDFDSKKNKK